LQKNKSLLPISTGQVSDPIQIFASLQSPMFLINSRPLCFLYPYPEVRGLFCLVPSIKLS